MSAKKFKGWEVITYKDVEETSADDEIKTNNIEKANNKPHPVSWGDLSAKPYWIRNLFPFLMEVAFLICCFKLPVDYIIYANFFFYLALLLFYLITKNLTFRKFKMNISSGVQFWKYVVMCSVLFGAAIGITHIIEHFFPTLDSGFYPLNVTNWLTLVIFIVTSLFLEPVVEETYFRGNLISVESKKMMIITSIASILLYSISHSFSLWGIISVLIWSVPMTFIFLKTRNVYVVMIAHFIVNLVFKIPIIISYF